MNIEKQVCSLDLAKRLKELGVKQDSLFYYQNNPYNDGEDCIDIMIKEWRSKNNENVIMNTQCENDDNPKYSAFTVAELGEMLKNLEFPDIYLSVTCQQLLGKEFHGLSLVTYSPDNKKIETISLDGYGSSICERNEADARAKMLIYLLENKIMELPK